jgi:hypothetical protein
MALVPATRTWTAGEIMTAGLLNTAVRDVDAFLLATPILDAWASFNQSIPNNAFTSLSCDTEYVDSSGMHSTSTNNSRATAVYAGWYDVGGLYTTVGNATGQRAARLLVNGGTEIQGSSVTTSGTSIIQALTLPRSLVYLNVNDYVECQGYQSSGAALNTGASLGYEPSMSAIWSSN